MIYEASQFSIPPQFDGGMFVYFMQNMRNGFIKIGLSRNPSFREKTLQSEEPEINLIAVVVGDRELETEIHGQFKNLRIRGEWFSITREHVKDLLLAWDFQIVMEVAE